MANIYRKQKRARSDAEKFSDKSEGDNDDLDEGYSTASNRPSKKNAKNKKKHLTSYNLSKIILSKNIKMQT